MPASYDHANQADWWDGPERFKRINRAEVSMIQKEAVLLALAILVPGKKVDVGGPDLPGDMLGLGDRESFFVHCNCNHPGTGDACALPFADGTISLVFSAHTVEHVRDLDLFLREADRVLRPGGIFYAICPDRRHFRHSDSDEPLDKKSLPDGERTYEEFAPEELLARLRARLPRYEVLSFDTRKNHYDFEIAIRKPA